MLALNKSSLVVEFGFGKARRMREPNFQTLKGIDVASHLRSLYSVRAILFRVRRTPKTLKHHHMAGHTSPHRIGSQTPTLKGKAPNF